MGATERLNSDFFKGGQVGIPEVYYDIDISGYLAFDWAHGGLEATARKEIEEGIVLWSHYKMRAMDRWTQTANLVFKPTSTVALAGLATDNSELIEWGFRRTKPWGRLARRLRCRPRHDAQGRRPLARGADLPDRAGGASDDRAAVTLARTLRPEGLVQCSICQWRLGEGPDGLLHRQRLSDRAHRSTALGRSASPTMAMARPTPWAT